MKADKHMVDDVAEGDNGHEPKMPVSAQLARAADHHARRNAKSGDLRLCIPGKSLIAKAFSISSKGTVARQSTYR